METRGQCLLLNALAMNIGILTTGNHQNFDRRHWLDAAEADGAGVDCADGWLPVRCLLAEAVLFTVRTERTTILVKHTVVQAARKVESRVTRLDQTTNRCTTLLTESTRQSTCPSSFTSDVVQQKPPNAFGVSFSVLMQTTGKQRTEIVYRDIIKGAFLSQTLPVIHR